SAHSVQLRWTPCAPVDCARPECPVFGPIRLDSAALGHDLLGDLVAYLLDGALGLARQLVSRLAEGPVLDASARQAGSERSAQRDAERAEHDRIVLDPLAKLLVAPLERLPSPGLVLLGPAVGRQPDQADADQRSRDRVVLDRVAEARQQVAGLRAALSADRKSVV